MNVKTIRILAVLASILMTVAMLAGIRAGFEAAPIQANQSLLR